MSRLLLGFAFLVSFCSLASAGGIADGYLKPNVVILLDRSGSMCWDPASTYYPCSGANSTYNYCNYGNLGACPTSPYYCIGCDAPLIGTNLYGNCSKIHLVTQALFSGLDADSNGVVEDKDSLALMLRIGYGHFYNSSSESSGIYIPYNGDTIGMHYSNLWADIQNEGVCSGAPLNISLWLAKELARTTHVREGPPFSSRKSYVIVITDGEDTFGCGGSGYGSSPAQRKAGVDVAYTSFQNDTIPVFVIGIPDLTDPYQHNTLNWMAYCGGTRTQGPYSGDTTAYQPVNTESTYQTCPPPSDTVDPGSCALSGYAYMVTDLAELQAAVKAIFNQIRPNGVAQNSSSLPPSAFPFRILPNPFTTFATAPGYETRRFKLYDVTGRLVAACRGDKIGEGLSAGVYYLKLDGYNSQPLRLVKLR